MSVQDCQIVTVRELPSFRLTAQRLADTHDITVNISFPLNPQSGDLHLVDYDGDNWWVLYRYGASVWTITAEIDSTPYVEVDNNPKIVWVNSDSNASLSAVNNINKPYTNLELAIAEVPVSATTSATLDEIIGSTGYFSWSLLPNI